MIFHESGSVFLYNIVYFFLTVHVVASWLLRIIFVGAHAIDVELVVFVLDCNAHVCIYIHKYICTGIHIYVYTYTQIYTYTYIIHVYICTCIYIYSFAHIYNVHT